MIDGISALTASKSALGSVGSTTAAGSGATGATGGADFSAMMNQISGDAVGTLKTAEASAIQGIQGSGSVHGVVESIMAAQRSLQSTLAIRDKAVAAYQEISRMAM